MLKKALASVSILSTIFLTLGLAGTVKAPATTGKSVATESPATAPTPGGTVAVADTQSVEKTIVYIKTGSRYHLKGCQYLKNKGKAITVGDAMKQGFAPCNVCHAPKIKRPA